RLVRVDSTPANTRLMCLAITVQR
ncbi:hypothetical protein BVZ43_01724B, partial [Haemophilus influenzae]